MSAFPSVPFEAPSVARATASAVRRRLSGDYDVDEWGLDPDLISTFDPLFALRWSIRVVGTENLPTIGGALLVFNRRLGISEPWVVARGVRQATGRFVRTVGAPDHAPVGPVLRRFGGVLDRPDEVSGLLGAGQLVGMPMGRDVINREHAGALHVARVRAAIDRGCPVVPVAAVGRELGREWKLVIGAPVAPRRKAGPLAAAELVEATRAAVQLQLDDGQSASWWW
ncbi:MAG: hypothetical protein GX643_17525 [Acidimicrobiales bacterium]|nr:hypothetical protein [Acidimicrobiales bacterium]